MNVQCESDVSSEVQNPGSRRSSAKGVGRGSMQIGHDVAVREDTATEVRMHMPMDQRPWETWAGADSKHPEGEGSRYYGV